MSSRLLFQPDRKQAPVPPQQSGGSPRILIMVIIGVAGLLFLGLLAVPALVGTDLFFAAGAGCSGQQTGTVGQPPAGAKARAIPADYLSWYKKVGQQYGVPWTILAGIGTVESDNGQTTLPGVHSGSNAFGAAGPMQIGIGGAAGKVWGGLAGPTRACTTPRTRSRARPSTCWSSRSRPTRRGPSSPTTTCSPTCRVCSTTPAPTRAATSAWSPPRCPRAVRRPGAPARP